MRLEKSWREKLQEEISLPYIKELKDFLQREKEAGKVIYPPEDLVFSAFRYAPYEQVQVVIIGQDPYHGPGQAQGLSFSVPHGVRIPPSLRNIFIEIHNDLGLPIPQTGCLIPWARQGVFLLNATLTVRQGEPKSHYARGWERFTDAVVDLLIQREDPLVFLLWGSLAQEKGKKIETCPRHKILIAAHPSPYSASGFLGCKHFSKANACLASWGRNAIDWSLVSGE
ncbi:MAG: uracil-DNA glycosylase [Chlamydiae bacterium]|nr:uracil-DNA glycosylase [Chlamydiota bacterium]